MPSRGEENMLESIDIQAIFSDYVAPWSINIVMAPLLSG